MAQPFWDRNKPDTAPAPVETCRRCKLFHEKTPVALEGAVNEWLGSNPGEVLGTHVVPWRDSTVMCFVFYAFTK